MKIDTVIQRNSDKTMLSAPL